jgi:hypothetical protein
LHPRARRSLCQGKSDHGRRNCQNPFAEPRCIMTISVTLTPDQERKLEALARQNGKDPSAFVSDMVTVYLNGVGSTGEKMFAEILAPIWEGWRQSGMTEDEIDDLFAQELQEVRWERRQQKGPSTARRQ